MIKIKKLFGNYKNSPLPDNIIGLTTLFNSDTRSNKLNLAIGYLYDETGQIYLPSSVEEAVSRIPHVQRGYLIPNEPLNWNGNPVFMEGIIRLIFEEYAETLLNNNLVAAATTVGGTQAISLFAAAA